MKKDVLAFLPENVESDTIKSPAQIKKVEEVPDNVTPYGEIERIPMTPMRKSYRSADGRILPDGANIHPQL